ncbi:MAG: PqqD family peptide modification chaperone [Anaerolineae bacterium]|nr:PqqD family peptide modification chaperone [Anaerolineae bacterium]
MTYPQQSKTVHIETLNDELCLYDWQRKGVHALNPTVAQVWQLCDGQTAPAQMAATLRGDLLSNLDAIQAQAVVEASLAQLQDAHLLDDLDVGQAEAAKAGGVKPLTRRQMLAWGLAAALVPTIASILAPSPVEAQSPVPTPTNTVVPPTPTATPTNTVVPPTPTATPPVTCPPLPIGDWVLLNSASVDGDWIRLTGVANNQRGAALYPTAFSFGSSFAISFDYAAFGGSGADGFSVFFYDGDNAYYPPTLGGPGGALSYASTPSLSINGLSHAYLGIGFDEWGGFSDPINGSGGPGNRPDSVVLRGSGNGLTGYNYLTGVSVSPRTIDGVTRASPRHVVVTLNSGLVTVMVDFGSGYETVINNYNLNTAPGQIAAPATLRVGIAASTGGATNNHDISNFGSCDPSAT